jgi:hypothetical protein
MTKTLTAAACAVALLAAGSALAVAKGGTLYIKAKNTKVYDKASASGKVKATLQPGDEVVWEGADKKDPQFHQISGKAKGFAHQSALSPKKPTGEVLTSDGEPVSGQAFASSGAATKALTEAGVKYAATKGPEAQAAAAQVIYVEEHTKNSATPDAIAKHQKAQKLTVSGGDK